MFTRSAPSPCWVVSSCKTDQAHGMISQYLQLLSQKGGGWGGGSHRSHPGRLSPGPWVTHVSRLLALCPASCSLFLHPASLRSSSSRERLRFCRSTQFASPITVYSLAMELFISKPHSLHVCFASFHGREISFIVSKQFYGFLPLFTKVRICSHLIERGGLYKHRKENKNLVSLHASKNVQI